LHYFPGNKDAELNKSAHLSFAETGVGVTGVGATGVEEEATVLANNDNCPEGSAYGVTFIEACW
jgi:hypothetical protein